MNRYPFNKQLLGGSFVSITLAFDRKVTFATDNNSNGQFDAVDTTGSGAYDQIDTFNVTTDVINDDQISDLDLYLLPKHSININQAIAASISAVSTVDHIFFQIPQTGEYEFWVHPHDADVGPQNYAVAWWR